MTTRSSMAAQERAVSDTLDEYLSRHHGLIVSHTHAGDFLAWLAERGWTVDYLDHEVGCPVAMGGCVCQGRPDESGPCRTS